jgi:hypothetical protein
MYPSGRPLDWYAKGPGLDLRKAKHTHRREEGKEGGREEDREGGKKGGGRDKSG